ncbi:MAG: hypothetical protein IPH72_31590 [Sandaracinaceae bacterium]|nr:hypothetical protein [Sandaracinaceae bacterium]
MDGLNPQRRSVEAAVPLNVAMSLSRATSGLPRSGFVQRVFCAIRCRSAVEYDARDRLNRGIAKCREVGDEGTRALLDRILKDEEGGIDWLESQLHIIGDIGKELYLAQQIR